MSNWSTRSIRKFIESIYFDCFINLLMTALPLCPNCVEWQDEQSCPLSTRVTLGEAWRNVPPTSDLSLLYYLPQYVAVNPNLSITLCSRRGQGGRQRSVRHGANFCGQTRLERQRRRRLMCVHYEAFNALNCEITTTTTATIMATKRPLINNKLNTRRRKKEEEAEELTKRAYKMHNNKANQTENDK